MTMFSIFVILSDNTQFVGDSAPLSVPVSVTLGARARKETFRKPNGDVSIAALAPFYKGRTPGRTVSVNVNVGHGRHSSKHQPGIAALAAPRAGSFSARCCG